MPGVNLALAFSVFSSFIASLCCNFSKSICSHPQGYGGFLTLMMLKSTDQLIKCAAVQAPIIDWSLYGEFQAVLAAFCGDTFITSAPPPVDPTQSFSYVLSVNVTSSLAPPVGVEPY